MIYQEDNLYSLLNILKIRLLNKYYFLKRVYN